MTVTVYRAVPATVTEIRADDWVALDEGYCLMHAEGMAEWQGVPWGVITAEVPVETVAWAGDLDEWHADTDEAREFVLV